jgi:hypothetical protein
METVHRDVTFEGTRDFTLANGVIHLTEALEVHYQRVGVHGVTSVLTIVGGTGAYANATGSLQLDGKVSFLADVDPGAHLKYKGALCGAPAP